jgi:hypothetical protein
MGRSHMALDVCASTQASAIELRLGYFICTVETAVSQEGVNVEDESDDTDHDRDRGGHRNRKRGRGVSRPAPMRWNPSPSPSLVLRPAFFTPHPFFTSHQGRLIDDRSLHAIHVRGLQSYSIDA